MTQYRLRNRVESGDLAELFRGERDGEPVVVKLFHARTSDPAYARAVSANARKLAEARHPLVAQVLEVGLVGDRLAVVRQDPGDFTLGQALQRLLTRDVVMSLPLALGWVIELGQVLHHAHQAGAQHGALTPGNVIVTDEGRLAICDFGALEALHAVPVLRRAFGQRGRSAYRAPDEKVSVAGDVYSLGVIAYELLTLRLPPAAGVRTRRSPPPPPSRLNRRLNARFDALVLRAIEASESRRYRSCLELSEALGDLVAQTGGLPTPSEKARFVEDLFSGSVPLEAPGALPVERFELEPLEGAELPALRDLEGDEAVHDRPVFSGPEADATAETVEALPAFEDYREPETRGRSVLSWDAPPAAQAPEGRRVSENADASADVHKRVKKVEDFQVLGEGRPNDTLEMPKPLAVVKPLPKAPAPPPKKEPPAPGLSVLRRANTEERSLATQGARRAKWLALAGTVFLVGGVVLMAFLWWRSTGSIPPPKLDGSVSRPPLPPKPISRPTPPPPVARPVDCYEPPTKKPSALVTVVLDRPARVEIDGEQVCGRPENVALTPGRHTVTVIDLRTKERDEQKQTFVSGKTVKVQPVFRSRR